jgi:hypothetical protein
MEESGRLLTWQTISPGFPEARLAEGEALLQTALIGRPQAHFVEIFVVRKAALVDTLQA